MSTSMLKHCGPLLNDMLTELVKCILTAVNGFLLSVVTKLIHRSMDFICEKLGYYGGIQYEFRNNRSIAICVYMLLSPIRCTKSDFDSVL